MVPINYFLSFNKFLIQRTRFDYAQHFPTIFPIVHKVLTDLILQNIEQCCENYYSHNDSTILAELFKIIGTETNLRVYEQWKFIFSHSILCIT